MNDMQKLTDEKYFSKSFSMNGRGTPGKVKEENRPTVQNSAMREKTLHSRPQTPNYSSQKLVHSQGKQKSREETDSKMNSDQLKQTPRIERPHRSSRCDSSSNTPVSHLCPSSCKRTLRLSCETPPSSRSTKNAEYFGATPLKILNRDEIPSCTETPECYSNVILDTPSHKHHCGDFQDLLGEESSNLTVGVRVRPLSYREKSAPSVTSVVNIVDNEVKLTCETGMIHRFFYDHCFWSSDTSDSEYADQETVFRVMAQPLLDKVLSGYNACLFAYGQTGSGKSYSMMGLETDGEKEYGREAGIIPRFCHALFRRIKEAEDEDGKKDSLSGNVAVEISYFEIYNEKIHDLLGSSSDRERKTPLKVREHPVLGPYVVDLSQHGVVSYEDLKGWLMVGNSQKATSSTVMNEKSSRSHSIFSITLTQQQKDVLNGEIYEHSRRSKINLVDLAGSERVSQTCATGERLREGVSINKSLLTLGKVIASLAENTSSKKRQFIPYRESVLTWLLKESLGGNSRTAMLATISPASVHLEETLATLRYACQARTIINRVRINEEPRDRVIRHLREEVERLRTSRGDCEFQRPLSPPDDNERIEDGTYEINQKKELEKLKEQLLLSKEEFAETQRRWSERLEQAENIKKEELTYLRRCGIALKLDIEKQACLINLTPDPILSGTLIYLIPPGHVNIGREDQIDSNTDIALSGPLIKDNHCTIENKAGGLTVIPGNGPCFINGVEVTEKHTLHHGDRLVIGGNHYFRVNNPDDADSSLKGGEPADYCFAHEEIRTVQENRLKTELEEAKKRAIIQLEEAEKKLGSQRSKYEMQIQELGKSLEHIEALAEVQKEKEKLSIKNSALEEKAKSVEKRIPNHGILDCSVDIPITPYRSNLLEEMMKVLNESTDDPEVLMPTDSFSLHDIKIMCLEAEERCKEAGINYDFYHQHVVKDHRLMPVIKVHDTDNDLVAVWEPDFFADWLHQLRVHEPGENITFLKRGNGTWEKCDEFSTEDDSSHLLSLSMNEIKRQLDETLTASDSNDSASTLFNQTSLSINNTFLEESEVGSSNCFVSEDVTSNLQQIDQGTYNLKRLFKDTGNKDVEECVNLLSNTVAKLKSLLMISDCENSWEDSSLLNTKIPSDHHLEKTDTQISPLETLRTENKYNRHHRVREKKSVRFIFTDSQQRIEDS